MPEESPPFSPPAEESLSTDCEPAAPEPELAESAPEPIAKPPFVCACQEWARKACKGKPFYKEREGKRYCVLHYPGKEKSTAFDAALQKKLADKEFDFSGVWFPEASDFSSFEFSTAANFDSAIFSAEANFGYAIFRAEANFSYVTFSAATNFGSAVFKDQVNFSGEQKIGSKSSFDFQQARIEKPERVFFHTMTLRPHWFVNVDARKFVFTDVSWNWKAISIKGEVAGLKGKEVSSPRRLLAIACGQLAENAENNNRYEEASRFRYWAMDLARQQKWAGPAFWKTDWLHVLYWAVSGYGERIWKALVSLAIIWVFFALLYTQVGFTKPEDKSATSTANPIITTEPDTIGQPLPIKRAFTYSLGVMSLQKPEPTPLTGTAQTLVLLETILGPLQAALLALAIRRKFMR